MEKLVIIGSGPAAHTAAIYTGRADLKPLLFEGFLAGGIASGGQLTTTTDVENYPGFPEGISGPALMERIRQQTLKFDVRIEPQTVTKLDLSAKPFKVFTDTMMVETQCLIIATGATARRLDIPGESRLWQKGISACAVCDGALPLFRNKVLVVIGGGDTAIEEATFLTKYASRIYLVHRRNELRACKFMQQKLFAHKTIEVIWDSVPVEAMGEKYLSQVKIKNVKTGKESILDASGLFYAIGHVPNTDFLNGQLDLDESGYIKTIPGTNKTSVIGVLAAGDVQDKVYRQAITAAGSGCMAALEAEKYLSERQQ